MRRLALVMVTLALAGASAASAASAREVLVFGAEVPPISSTLGTFVGASHGGLVGAWRIQIEHAELRTGPTVAITGGAFAMRLRNGHELSSPVVGGSVSVRRPGARCTNQVYLVRVRLAAGSFAGTLTHRRRSFFGRCVIYAATISGRASLAS